MYSQLRMFPRNARPYSSRGIFKQGNIQHYSMRLYAYIRSSMSVVKCKSSAYYYLTCTNVNYTVQTIIVMVMEFHMNYNRSKILHKLECLWRLQLLFSYLLSSDIIHFPTAFFDNSPHCSIIEFSISSVICSLYYHEENRSLGELSFNNFSALNLFTQYITVCLSCFKSWLNRRGQLTFTRASSARAAYSLSNNRQPKLHGHA